MTRASPWARSALAAAAAALPLFIVNGAFAAMADQVVVKDAQTGELRAPTPDEAAALRARPRAQSQLRANTQAPEIKYHPSGARGARLPAQYMSYSVAVKGDDGQVHTDCVDGPARAEAVMKDRPRVERTMKDRPRLGEWVMKDRPRLERVMKDRPRHDAAYGPQGPSEE